MDLDDWMRDRHFVELAAHYRLAFGAMKSQWPVRDVRVNFERDGRSIEDSEWYGEVDVVVRFPDGHVGTETTRVEGALSPGHVIAGLFRLLEQRYGPPRPAQPHTAMSGLHH